MPNVTIAFLHWKRNLRKFTKKTPTIAQDTLIDL